MATTTATEPPADEPRSEPTHRPAAAVGLGQRARALAKWQRIGLIAAVLLMGVGAVLSFTVESSPPSTGESGMGAMSTNLVPGPTGNQGGHPPGQAAANAAGVPWSEAIFKYGFSFFIGFAMGYAVRSFLKLALIFCGVLALTLFALEYAGFVSVEWGAMDAAFTGLVDRVKEQAQGFRSFITGSLPSAGLAATGIYAGFRKG